MNVYLIMNESCIKGTDVPLTEIVSGHTTLQKALDALNDIARSADVELDENETSFYVKPIPSFDSDEYYIECLELDNNER